MRKSFRGMIVAYLELPLPEVTVCPFLKKYFIVQFPSHFARTIITVFRTPGCFLRSHIFFHDARVNHGIAVTESKRSFEDLTD
jgi:hypothetical protein